MADERWIYPLHCGDLAVLRDFRRTAEQKCRDEATGKAKVMDENWIDVGPTELLRSQTLQRHKVGRLEIALSCVGEKFGAVHNVCNHAGGPLGEGALDGDYIVCPWHQWKFHRVTGLGEPDSRTIGYRLFQ